MRLTHRLSIALFLTPLIAASGAHAQTAVPPSSATPSQTPQAPRPAGAAQVPLPSWLRFTAEYRGRFERPTHLAFTETRNDEYWLNRVRVAVKVRPSRRLLFQMQLQDAHVYGEGVVPSAPPYQDTLDVRTAFGEVGEAGKSPLVARIGRQELAFGDQRLLGPVNWINTARTFDAARLTVTRRAITLDGFAGSVVAMADKQWNRRTKGALLYGAYSAFSAAIPKAAFEPYVIVKQLADQRSEAGQVGRLITTTIGARLAGKLPLAFDYNLESALQRGTLATDRTSAWAGHWQLGRTIEARKAVRVFGEYNFASGDERANDGRRQTFDQLYPTPHDKYGLSDQVGWRNIHDLRAGIELKPAPKWTLAGGYHSWWLASLRDNLYAASSAILVRANASASSRHVGQELDVQTTYALAPRIQLAGGFAHIFPGAFLSAATPGFGYSLPYLMVTTTLLKGDR